MDPRRRPRPGALFTGVVTVVLLAGCTRPASYPHGHASSTWTDGSVLRTVALYVLVPAALFAVIGGLAWFTGGKRGTRYRPQFGWSAAPVWFAGPTDPVTAVESAEPGDVVRGGAGGSW